MENQNQTQTTAVAPSYMNQPVSRKQAAGISVLATVGVLIGAKLARMATNAIGTFLEDREAAKQTPAKP